MSRYNNRRLAVKRWADRYFSRPCTVRHMYKTELSDKWCTKVGYPFADHINEIAGKGLVVQPYTYNGISIPDYAVPIYLDEAWASNKTAAFFIPKEAMRKVVNQIT